MRPRAESPYWVYLARFSGEARRTMSRCLDRIAAMMAGMPDSEPVSRDIGEQIRWEQMRYAYAVLLRTRLAERWTSPSSVNKHLSALRGVAREAWRLGLMNAEDYERVRDIANLKGTRELAGRSIHAEEIAAFLAVCLADPTPAGPRDAALCAVLQSTGIRRAEAAGSLIERYDRAERGLKVIGKGNKERTVYVHPGAAPYLERWLAVIGERNGAIFRAVDRWNHVGGESLSPRAIGHIVNRRRCAAGLAPLSTHDYRRTFIGDFIDAGGDLVQAQQLAGHASATTTAQYDRRPERARRAAVDRLSLPSPAELEVPVGTLEDRQSERPPH
jgi:site-specific recombinase XerD